MSDKYYRAYEHRYRSVYRQGVKYWSDFPLELQEDLAGLDSFLAFAGARAGHRILEPGCGEGPLAVPLIKKGLDYLGVDLAPSALRKARLRLKEAGLQGRRRFVLHDATDLSFLPAESFDLAVDNRFLHMLVVDGDRRAYHAGLRRVLKPGSYVLFNQELYREGAHPGPVESFQRYLEVFRPDLATPEERTAYYEGREIKVRIPRVAARPKDRAGYVAEMEAGGFRMVHFEVLESGLSCRFYARRE